MIRIAVVEDEKLAWELLQKMLKRYSEERHLLFNIVYYESAEDFIRKFTSEFDLVFMDIQMPDMDGMQAAKKLRDQDGEIPLVFVTNLAQMASQGYDVQAFDFLIKPLHYDSFALHMNRVVQFLNKRQRQKVLISSGGQKICIAVEDIYYVEVRNHTLIYHTSSEDYSQRGSMGSAQKLLAGQNFSLCNNCYLVNLRHVYAVDKYNVSVGNSVLQISHPKKKKFMEELNAYIGGSVI